MNRQIQQITSARRNLDNVLFELEYGGDITEDMRYAASVAIGVNVDDTTISNAIEKHKNTKLDDLQTTLRSKVRELKASGGRGVELVDEIDSLRIAKAIRHLESKKKKKKTDKV